MLATDVSITIINVPLIISQVESCRLTDTLPDLKQNHLFVRSTLKKWIRDTIQTYGFDGIRVDTARQVPKDFWIEYCQEAGVYSIGEIFDDNSNYVAGYQGPLSALLNYPMWYKLNDVFLGRKSMYEIRTGITENQQAFRDTTVLGNFLDNHDNSRFLGHDHSDTNTMKNGLAYIIFAEVQMYACLLCVRLYISFSNIRVFHLSTMALNKDTVDVLILQIGRVSGPTTTLKVTCTSS